MTNTAVDEDQSPRTWAMGDILVRHRTGPNLWKILGRVGNRVVLFTGESVRDPPASSTLSRLVPTCSRRGAAIFAPQVNAGTMGACRRLRLGLQLLYCVTHVAPNPHVGAALVSKDEHVAIGLLLEPGAEREQVQ
ncbi:hypothetical protein BD413DRAFT_611914 [Trametes elegans]|nr:hypothetical protein BD413DRAFT_611914 [Trametes elegans]